MPEQLLPLPKQVFGGLSALTKLGKSGVGIICQVQSSAPLDLDLEKIFANLSQLTKCQVYDIQRAIMESLVPLNGLRRSFELPTVDFINSLEFTVRNRATKEWKAEFESGWNEILPLLEPLFQPDNFFSQVSKALELLSLRPAVLQHARIINDLRPVFDEDTTRTLAVLQTSTLVIRYWEDQQVRICHLTLDEGDLEALLEEIQRAQLKTSIASAEATRSGVRFVTYGSQSDAEES